MTTNLILGWLAFIMLYLTTFRVLLKSEREGPWLYVCRRGFHSSIDHEKGSRQVVGLQDGLTEYKTLPCASERATSGWKHEEYTFLQVEYKMASQPDSRSSNSYYSAR